MASLGHRKPLENSSMHEQKYRITRNISPRWWIMKKFRYLSVLKLAVCLVSQIVVYWIGVEREKNGSPIGIVLLV
jgi:hypothetical protein